MVIGICWRRVRISEILDQVRYCTSTQNGNQHQLGGYALVILRGKEGYCDIKGTLILQYGQVSKYRHVLL